MPFFKKSKKNQSVFRLPVIPVKDILVFPHTTVPMFLGRQISIKAVQCAIRDNCDILVVPQFYGEFSENVDIEQLPKLGTICKITQSMKLPDGNYKITLIAVSRALVSNFKNSKEGYIFADARIPKLMNENELDKREFKVLIKKLANELSAYLPSHDTNLTSYEIDKILTENNYDAMSDILTARLNFKTEDKADILQTFEPVARMKKLIRALNNENCIVKVEKEIKRETDNVLNKNNREFYLREQLKVIQKELGSKVDEGDIFDLQAKYEKLISTKKLPKYVEEKVREEMKKLRYLGAMSGEAGVVRGYLDTIFALPWNEESKLSNDFQKAEKILNDSHYGMEKAKERVLESIAVQMRTGEQPKKTILCLYGAPGVGKTSLAKAIADATGRKYVKIALGGVGDESEIRGHRKTYLGSMPGKIIDAMKKAQTTNPLILLDEIDKIITDNRGDPAAALLEVLDYQQNNKFVDHYLELEYDLSNVMFVATANSLKISPALRDRLEIIKIPSYLEQEKFKIAKNYIIPRQLKENGLTEKDCKITDSAIIETIKHYTLEAGVRELERKIAKLCRKAVMNLMQNKNKQVEISANNIKDYLGVQKYTHTVIERRDTYGVVNGLAYTEVGGDVLMIEAVKIPGKGEIKYTGELGNVMKESIQIAFSLVKAHMKEFNINPDVFKYYDVHIHCPEGATPKDGPSAGIAMTTAIVSLLTGKTVNRHLAMTGEISLRGAVLPIGGLREKLTGAVRSGVQEVIIPKDNVKDLEEIPENILKKLKIIPCGRIESVIREVFGNKSTQNFDIYKNQDLQKNIEEMKNNTSISHQQNNILKAEI